MRQDPLSDLAQHAARQALVLLGALWEEGKTIVLLGPDLARFWAHVQSQPEAAGADPVDRWSTRVITDLARTWGAEARFPFGTPAQPFLRWALAAGCAQSPVGLLIHPAQGLWVSFRGALVFDAALPLPAKSPVPCDTCDDRPCLTACPVGALSETGYDLPACHAHLDDPRSLCMGQGCAVRRACPASPPRPDAQSAHHMAYFHP